MFESIENIQLRYSAFYPNRSAREIKPREVHKIIFVTSGVALHDFGNKKIETPKGSFIFIPLGTQYNYQPATDEPCSYVTLSFLADFKNAYPAKFSMDGLPDAYNFAINLFNLWREGTLISKHECLSMFHNLVAHILKLEYADYSNIRKKSIIEPAIIYLNAHVFDRSLRIDSLYSLCNISPAYFRRIFHSIYGTNPQKYVEDKRLSYAKSIVEFDDSFTISEISEMVGYNDPLYFGKVFKKKYGLSPSYIASKEHL